MGASVEEVKEAGLFDLCSTRAIGGSRSEPAEPAAKPADSWLSVAIVDPSLPAPRYPAISTASGIDLNPDSANNPTPTPSASLPPSASALAG